MWPCAPAPGGATLHLSGLRYARPARRNEPDPFGLSVDCLTLFPGDVLALVGPSGCGKSTLIDLAAMLRAPGMCEKFELMGADVAALWRQRDVAGCTRLRGRFLGVVLQTGGLIGSLPLVDNVRLSQRLLGTSDDAWIDHLLDVLGLADLRYRLPAQLSIGQRQRVAIARALSHRPALVLADEPTASLGLDHAEPVMQLLFELTRSSGCALLIASHDVGAMERHGVSIRQATRCDDGVHFDEPKEAP